MKIIIKTGLAAILLLAISCKKEGSLIADKSSTQAIIADINELAKYPSVLIHGQRWMTTNLAVSRYRNGDKIPHEKDAAKWSALTTGAWCWYNNDSATGAVYGKLYNWWAVHDPRGLAPTGWHIPSDAEWDTLSIHLGGDAVAGGKLKDTGTIQAGTGLWWKPNTRATNKTSFTALPGGVRYYDGSFTQIGFFGDWWSSTEGGANVAWNCYLYYSSGAISRGDNGKQSGFSVRCIKD